MSGTVLELTKPKRDTAPKDYPFRRADGALVTRGEPKLRPIGSHPCGCGRTISANKDKCLACNGGAMK